MVIFGKHIDKRAADRAKRIFTLEDFAGSGWIETGRGTITVLDVDSLRHRARE